jgi:hypothetical protein
MTSVDAFRLSANPQAALPIGQQSGYIQRAPVDTRGNPAKCGTVRSKTREPYFSIEPFDDCINAAQRARIQSTGIHAVGQPVKKRLETPFELN